eukprot:1641855-Rhodomonas_salina.1
MSGTDIVYARFVLREAVSWHPSSRSRPTRCPVLVLRMPRILYWLARYLSSSMRCQVLRQRVRRPGALAGGGDEEALAQLNPAQKGL